MVHKVSCQTRDDWLAQLYGYLEGQIKSVLPIAPGPVERETAIGARFRGMESLAETLEILLKMDCEVSATSFGRSFQESTLEEKCEDATENFKTGYDAGVNMLRALRRTRPGPELELSIKQFEDQRDAAIEDFRKRCAELGGPPLEIQIPLFAQDWYQGLGAKIGGAAAGVGAGAALTAAGAAPLAPIVVPIAAAAGAQAGEAAEREAPKIAAAIGKVLGAMRVDEYGPIAEYAAVFRGRESAVNLSRAYQANGVPAFAFYDPNAIRPAIPTMTEIDPATGLPVKVVKEPVPELDPVTKQPVRGVWRVEVGHPDETEKELQKLGKVIVVGPSEPVPKDPKHELFLVFPPAVQFGDAASRPTVLDALIDAEYGAIFTGKAEEKAPCKCVEIPESGKLLCTRPGAIGLLSQAQVRTRCSETIPVANGRLERVRKLREAQSICNTLVAGIEDRGQRLAERFQCLSDQLKE